MEEAEEAICELASDGSVLLKIDRPRRIIAFGTQWSDEEYISSWTHDISKVLSMTEATCHLIRREQMVHKVY